MAKMRERKRNNSKVWNMLPILLVLTNIAVNCEEIQSDGQVFSHVIDVPELEEYVNTERGRNLLKEEYHSIPNGMRRPAEIALLPENIKKNRYDDLPAFDATRVKLELIDDDPTTNYINANYINGYHRNNEYVATQGPLPNTINDFWRMIWQLNATKIIMLANIIEHGKTKVEKYWPEEEEQYGQINVKMISEVPIGDEHVIRTFLLEKDGVSEKRIVRHFHFTGWPDMGVPSDRLSIVSLLQQARKYRPEIKTPIVVHCSAGVGRTGTVILTDSMLEKAKAENKVDFPKRLDSMRLQRIEVVEKEDQYLFAHEAINDVFNKRTSTEYLERVDEEYSKKLGETNDNIESMNLFSTASSLSSSLVEMLNPLSYF